MFKQPMIDSGSVWETLKNIHYYFLFDELVLQKFTLKKNNFITKIALILKVQLMEIANHKILALGFFS